MFSASRRFAAAILDGRQLSLNIRTRVREEAVALYAQVERKPGLAIIQVGEDAPSKVYVGHKVKAAQDCHLHVEHLKLPRTSNEANILATIHAINKNDQIHGVILQLPVDSVEKVDVDRCIEAIDPNKDVDGLHFKNAGQLARGMIESGTLLPCTPRGCMELLHTHAPNGIQGLKAVVLGRSKIVGSPIAEMLKWADVTVTTVHSRTPPEQAIAFCRDADIVVAACRQPEFVKGHMLKPGAMVIDVGINSMPDATKKSGARIVGDVDFDSCKEVAGFITPVPGHVGPMTIAMLLQNTLDAAKRFMVADFTRWETRPLSIPNVRPDVDDFALNQTVTPKHITEIAKEMRLFSHEVLQRGPFKAKLDPEQILRRVGNAHRGKYVVVSSVTPSKEGEGKTTTVLGLSAAFNAHLGVNCLPTLREPTLGPLFSIKGGGTGGGFSQVIPSQDMNLHFNGDIHAVCAAHNLLAAATDNCIAREDSTDAAQLFSRLTNGGTYFTQAQLERLAALGITETNPSDFTLEQMERMKLGLVRDEMTIRRVLDTNDRYIEEHFDCAASSEIMNILTLAQDYEDLSERLKRVIVGRDIHGGFVTARDVGVDGAMAILMKNAVQPNLTQTMEGTPVMVHSGPFASLGPGVSSVMADTLALRLVGNDGFVVTEAGFGSDLGLEKFMHIKSTRLDDILRPDVCVLVLTTKSLLITGRKVCEGATKKEMLRMGMEFNLKRHIDNVKQFNIPLVVAVNTFDDDSGEELETLRQNSLEYGADDAVICRNFQEGGRGTVALAESVQRLSREKYELARLYDLEDSVEDKLYALATKVHGRKDILFSDEAKRSLEVLSRFKKLPVCVTTSPYNYHSQSHPDALPVTTLRVQAGAGLLIAGCGATHRSMASLPSRPRFLDMGVTDGTIYGL